jgi:hypothetical protein
MPFPIQRIQTDRGLEFFAENVQRGLVEWAIKFRPVPPRSPHLTDVIDKNFFAGLLSLWKIEVEPISDLAIHLTAARLPSGTPCQ